MDEGGADATPPEETTTEEAPAAAEGATDAEDAAPEADETEVFYTFTWSSPRRSSRGPRREGQGQGRGQPRGDRPKGKGKPKGPRPEKGGKAQRYEAKPKREKAIDPDNPFAALAALKDK